MRLRDLLNKLLLFHWPYFICWSFLMPSKLGSTCSIFMIQVLGGSLTMHCGFERYIGRKKSPNANSGENI